MNDRPSQARPKLGKARWWLWPAVVLLSLALGLTHCWYSLWTAPSRQFRAGVEAFKAGDLDKVQVCAESLRGLEKYEPHVHLLEGMVLLRRGRPVEAIVEFGHARDHPHTRALAYGLSGEALYSTKQFRDALPILTTALELDPSQTDARRFLASTYFDIGAMNHAIAELRVVAKQAPDDPRPNRLTALIYKDFEQYAKATENYHESLRRDPNQSDKEQMLLELAECLVRQRKHEEALKTLSQCSPSPNTLWLEAECRYGQNDRASAKKLLTEVFQSAPDHLDALRLQSQIDMEAGDMEAIVDVLTRAVKYHPKEWRIRYTLGTAYQRLGDSERAAEQFKAMDKYRELRDRFTELHDKAMEDPANAEIRYQLGLAAFELDKPSLAETWLRTTLYMSPEHAGARQALDQIVAAGRQSLPTADNASQ